MTMKKTAAQQILEMKKALTRMTPTERRLWAEFNEHIRGAMLALGELFKIEQTRKHLGLRNVTLVKARRLVREIATSTSAKKKR